MPTALVKKVAKVCDRPVKDIETLWDKAKKRALASTSVELTKGTSDYWAYVMGIFKKSLGNACKNKYPGFEALVDELGSADMLVSQIEGVGDDV